MEKHSLDTFFRPRSVAVVGASPRASSVAGQVLANLQASGFAGALYPVNPKHREVGGIPCVRRLDDISDSVDLAVIGTPAATVPELIETCGRRGIGAAIVLSAGFREGEPKGAALEERLLAHAHHHGVRVLGPNCLGLLAPHAKLNATFGKGQAHAGNLALVSQSGALCTAILDWAAPRSIGFSALVSIGEAADIDFGDMLDYFALDEQTSSILLYVEGVRHARRFMSGLRAAARMKPVVVLKAGRHEAASQAARSHTGALVGSDDAFDAALARAGAVRVPSIGQLFSTAQALASGCRVQGNRLAIVTNAGGPGVMATDRAVDLGVEVVSLSRSTLDALDQHLPPAWSHGNPVDVLGDAPPARYEHAVQACLDDAAVDGVLVILTPQAMTEPSEVAHTLITTAAKQHKPLLTCFMGDEQVNQAWRSIGEAKLPHFRTPEAAVEAFATLARFRRNQTMLLEVPGPRTDARAPDVEGARLIIEGALAQGRAWLGGAEARAVMRAFHIPALPLVNARSASEALVAAETIGFPVAMKINSAHITHKTDVGGVKLNISTAADVRHAYTQMMADVKRAQPDAELDGVTIEPMSPMRHGRELLVGVSRDASFGPVIAFGAGGTAVEIMRDRSVALPPLNATLTRRLIERTRVSRLLGAYRNLPAVKLEAIEAVLLRVSELVCELPHVVEMDLNPLMADDEHAVVVDARLRVAPVAPASAPYSHMAIHPYPAHLEMRTQLADGTDILVRPIRPEDATLEAEFVRTLSEESKYSRFMHSFRELTPTMLVRFTQIDYDREMALVAVTEDERTEVGVARYICQGDDGSAEFALVVGDAWQNRGVGTLLMQRLLDVARRRGIKTIQGDVMGTNSAMLNLVRTLGFVLRDHPDEPALTRVTCDLRNVPL